MIDRYITLNIAAGKLNPIKIFDKTLTKKQICVNVDTAYYGGDLPPFIEFECLRSANPRQTFHTSTSIFEFLERTRITFDQVCIYRFLEHIPNDKLLYFIYLISTVTRKGSIIDVIVPNYKLLADMILKDNPYDNDFERKNIVLTTELLNEKSDPHCSIWTLDRMDYFWELEKRFNVYDVDEQYKFDGRDIYLRALIERL